MPFRSKKQRRYFHYLESKGKLPSSINIKEWESATKGPLPERVSKGEIESWLDKAVLDPSAGYKISHETFTHPNGIQTLHVKAHAPNGQQVGFANFVHSGNSIKSTGIGVDEDHQRRGLATAMGSHALNITGKPIDPGVMTD